ncbi:putative phage abortive infection protein [Acinetobacter bereziniae]|uniref:putative phage abortive infection protein n=1 Tax=Acinetobacter bereziniae TaxID=106648 RepID=UPI0019039BEF|nr:putative phage abortive infection protein [Acinetobacter bereziniae]MDG3556347.1 putative phage abortive infection protein [Acinetobacter bereziniae]MDP6000443.1 putative phage abortive infection protein [Acinetobacter bereziniae]QQC79827.1 hypothetical protein I9192_17960 [Acinetobacter bereziniae]UUN92912.1 putative phage abortive infection protein [Acinetobacter bereziniae]WMW73978.1 putative phage abortive infection protein [Acinetobacter bereziniae]
MSSSEFDNQDENLRNIERKIKWSISIAIILIVGVLGIYFFNFHGEIDSNQGTWGTFGDFVGGTLNPVLAALAFYWLTSSIRLQLQELRDTRDVLKDTSDHQKTIALLEEQNVRTQEKILILQNDSLEKQIQSAIEQQQQIAIQNFENIFFELLKTKNDVIQDITCEYKRITLENKSGSEIIKLRGKEAISHHIKYFKTNFEGTWKEYYENFLVGSFSTYFRVCYQIVRLIDNNDALKNFDDFDGKGYSHKQKQYFDIFKATLQQSELESLFFNGLNGYNKYKKIIEKYGLFEPLLIDVGKDGLIRFLTQYAYMYDECAFCDNDYFYVYFEDLNGINREFDFNIIDDLVCILIDHNIIYSFYPDNQTKLLSFKGGDFDGFINLIESKVVPRKKDFINMRLREVANSNDEVFKSRTIEQIESVEEEIKNINNMEYLKAIYALTKYHINYEDYFKYFDDKLR